MAGNGILWKALPFGSVENDPIEKERIFNDFGYNRLLGCVVESF